MKRKTTKWLGCLFATTAIAVTTATAADEAGSSWIQPDNSPAQRQVKGGASKAISYQLSVRYHIILTDLHGHCTGMDKAFIYLTSTDGLKYQLVSKDPLMANAKPIRFVDGSETKFSRIERPQVVLNEKGEVIAILAACLPQDSGKTGDGSRILVFPVDLHSAVK